MERSPAPWRRSWLGGILLVFPIVWIGRKLVDIHPSIERLAWIYFLKVYEEQELEIRFAVLIWSTDPKLLYRGQEK